MPRPTKNVSIQSIIEDSVREIVARVFGSIGHVVMQMVAEEFKKRPGRPSNRRSRRRDDGVARPRRGEEITKWVADNRARRVPKFVIEMTGLDTKKKIVAKYGDNALFERGKPSPKTAKAA